MSVQTAALDSRAQLLRASSTVAEGGGVETAFAPGETVWASLRYLKGKESEQSQQIYADADVLIVIRHSAAVSDLTAHDRVRIGGQTFEIGAVLPMPGGRPRELHIYARTFRS